MNEENKVVNFEEATQEMTNKKKGIINAFKELSTPKKIVIGAAGVLVIAGGVVLGRKLMVKPVEEVIDEAMKVAEETGSTVVEF